MPTLLAFFQSPLGNVLLALLVPIGWGLLSAWFFDRLRERANRRKACDLPEGGRKG